MKILIIAVLLLISQVSTAQVEPFEILNPQVSQGDTLVVRINSLWRNPGIGVAVFDKFYYSNASGYIFIGIGRDVEPREYPVYFQKYEIIMHDTAPVRVEVNERTFLQWFRGPSPKLTKDAKEKLGKAEGIKKNAYARASPENDYSSGIYVNPLQEMIVKDEFGTDRIYGTFSKNKSQINIQKIIPHGGIDLQASVGTKVFAVNSGKVVLAKFIRGTSDGNLLMIDHGFGIISLYLHLSRFAVKEGMFVTKSQIVAYTGNTGRVPPHLDFRIKVHDTYVDPLKFIETVNQLK